MKRVEVIRGKDRELIPFVLSEYLVPQKTSAYEKINKKTLRAIADELELAYDESYIVFAKKVLNTYIKRQR